MRSAELSDLASRPRRNRSRRPQSIPPVEQPVRRREGFPVKLRHLLTLALLGLAGSWLWPRGQAAWRLHHLSVVKADHSLCMVGPMGPRLLKEDGAGMQELLRRRVLLSAPDAVPFSKCIAMAEDIGLPHGALRAHRAKAREFVEHRAGPAEMTPHSVADFDLSTKDLEDLADQAWPFVRGGYLRLVEASRSAKEAPHPAELRSPGVGSGLPAGRYAYRSTLAFGDRVVAAFGSGANAQTYVSNDRGVSWTRGGSRIASAIIDRCVVDTDGRAFTLSLTETGRRVVVSEGPGAAPQASVLSEPKQKLAAVACDDSALIAALVSEADAKGRRPVSLRLCPFRRPCRDMQLPETGTEGLFYPVDIARLGGDTVLSRSHAGVTRTTLSRDDGRRWAPFSVAFDSESVTRGMRAPFRFLTAGDRVLLYGGGEGSYPLLVSDDHGASFHAP